MFGRWLRRGEATSGVANGSYRLLPALTIIENVMLPMDFCGIYTPRERRERARKVVAHA